MILPIQFKIKENPYYLKYLRSHSNWYKLLNRDSSMFKIFEEEAKKEFRMIKEDRIKNIFDTFEMAQKILSTFK